MIGVGHRRAGGEKASFLGRLRRATRSVEGSAPFRWLVRAGFVSRGITYGLIGLLAFALAVGAGTMGARPSQQGALALIARATLGWVALALVAVGLIAYAVWKITQGIRGHGPEGGGSMNLFDRVANLAGGVAYVGFFMVAVRALAAPDGSSSSEAKTAAAGVLGWPGGPILVGGAGVLLLAISVYQVYDAIRGKFAQEAKTPRMRREERRMFMLLGRVGLCARSIVFALIGYFLVRTAIDFDPAKAVGVDGALARLHRQPLGPWLVGIVATGLLTFAVFSLLEARYRRL